MTVFLIYMVPIDELRQIDVSCCVTHRTDIVALADLMLDR